MPSEAGSAAPEAKPAEFEYDPAQCLREEVDRFKQTNRFNALQVTGFYIQAAVVLHEHEAMVKALRLIQGRSDASEYVRKLAAVSLPFSEQRKDERKVK